MFGNAIDTDATVDLLVGPVDPALLIAEAQSRKGVGLHGGLDRPQVLQILIQHLVEGGVSAIPVGRPLTLAPVRPQPYHFHLALVHPPRPEAQLLDEIGRASCRERASTS